MTRGYYEDKARAKRSGAVLVTAVHYAREVWGDEVDVSTLNNGQQRRFVIALRKAGLADSTIKLYQSRLWTSFCYHRDEYDDELRVPGCLRKSGWPAEGAKKMKGKEPYSREELARLLNAAGRRNAEGSRVEAWWRYLVLAIATASRPTALHELTWEQIKLPLRRLYLNPEGREQTPKRRATVVIPPTLETEVLSWDRSGRFVVSGREIPFAARTFFGPLARAAGVRGTAGLIRHTVRTWLALRGVPNDQADLFMGHRDDGSRTADYYKHLNPEYLAPVAAAIEAIYGELAALLEVPLGLHRPGALKNI